MGDLENQKVTLDFILNLENKNDKPIYPISLSLVILLNLITLYVLWTSK